VEFEIYLYLTFLLTSLFSLPHFMPRQLPRRELEKIAGAVDAVGGSCM